MNRSSELKRTPMPARSAPMRRTAAKRTAPPITGFSAEAKLAIRTRAGFGDPGQASCEGCGRFLGRYGGDCQHRYARKAGGSRLHDNIANGALLCSDRDGPGARDPADPRSCHRRCEDRDEDMHEEGFWLEYGEEPLAKAILRHTCGGGFLTLLDDAGNYAGRPVARAAS